MTMEITPAEMLAQLRTIAEKKMAENGGVDYVYERHVAPEDAFRCLYVHQTDMGLQPSCIIGHWAVQDQGVALEAFGQVEGKPASPALSLLQVLSGGDGPDVRIVHTIANRVQGLQDDGVPWLLAVKKVEEEWKTGKL